MVTPFGKVSGKGRGVTDIRRQMVMLLCSLTLVWKIKDGRYTDFSILPPQARRMIDQISSRTLNCMWCWSSDMEDGTWRASCLIMPGTSWVSSFRSGCQQCFQSLKCLHLLIHLCILSSFVSVWFVTESLILAFVLTVIHSCPSLFLPCSLMPSFSHSGGPGLPFSSFFCVCCFCFSAGCGPLRTSFSHSCFSALSFFFP